MRFISSITLMSVLLASCASQSEKTVIDPKVMKQAAAQKHQEVVVKLEDIQKQEELKTEQAEEFLKQPSVIVVPLGKTPLKPLTPKMGITAAVDAYEMSGMADPIIIGVNQIAWPYGLSQPKMACAQLRVCSIALQEQEEILDIVTGDAQRWNITIANSGGEKGSKPHVMVKPLAAGPLDTNLLITTSRRVYHIELSSVEDGVYTPQMEFYYPNEPLISSDRAVTDRVKDKDAKSVPSSSTLVALDQMNFEYQIKGKERLSWYPVRVFDDGSKVFIQMKPGFSSGEAPVFLVDENGKQELVNFRYRAPYFIIDRLFEKGVLALGDEDNQEVITISKKRKGFRLWNR